MAVEAAVRLLEVIARRGRDARARDILAAEGVAPFRIGLADLLIGNVSLPCRAQMRAMPSACIALRDGSLAYGLGLAFGHATRRRSNA